jgi:glycine cleavage system aminomethyltransferase T
LVRLQIDGTEPPPPGTKAIANAAEVGEITSAVYSPQSGATAALAYLRTQFTAPGTNVLVAEREARVVG